MQAASLPAACRLIICAVLALMLGGYSLAARADIGPSGPDASLDASTEARGVILANPDSPPIYPASSRITVGALEGMAPLVSRNERNGGVRGLAVDYLDIIARAIGVQARIRFYQDLDSLTVALKAGEIDAAVGADATLASADFPRSIAFHDSPVVIVTRAESRGEPAPFNDGAGFLRSMLGEQLAARTAPQASLHPIDNYYEGLLRVATRQDSAFVADIISSSAYRDATLFYTLKTRPVSGGLRTRYTFVFSPARTDLPPRFDHVLTSIPNYMRAAMERRWVEPDLEERGNRLNLTAAEQQWIKDHPRVTVAASSFVIPFMYRDSDRQAAGIAASVLDLVSARTGLHFTYEFYDSAADRLHAIREGSVDMGGLMQGNYPDLSGMLTTRPIMWTTHAVIARVDGPSPRNIEELRNIPVALVSASPLKARLEAMPSDQPPQVITAATGLAALSAVAMGQADATVLMYPSAEYLIAQYYQGKLRITGTGPYNAVPLLYPVSTNHPLLASILEKALDTITEDELNFVVSQWQYSEPLEFRWAARGPLIQKLIVAGSLAGILLLAWLAILLARFLNRRHNDRLVRERLELKRQMIDTNPNPMYVWSPDGIMIACNEAFQRLVKAPIVGMNLTLEGIATLDTASRETIKRTYDQVKATHKPHFSEMTLMVGGRELIGQHWVVPLLSAHGEIQAILGGWVDLTDLKNTERSLQQAIERADSANKAKTLFLATISHEIRTPMNVVVGTLELLKEGKPKDVSATAKQQVALAYDSATALLLLLNDILHYSKIEAGELSLHFTVGNLSEALPRWVASFNRSAEAKNLKLTTRIIDELPADLVFDSGRLRQIINNLVANAIKFTQRGSITVEAGTVGREADGCTVRISVRDTGIGIPATAIPHLFSPFQQATAGTYERYGGTGMGLAICKKLAELFGGSISLDSIEGQGTTVAVSIPMRYGEGWSPPLATDVGATEQLPELKLPVGSRLLIVDDHPSNRMLLETQLRLLGFDVLAASSGLEALEALDQSWSTNADTEGIAAIITDCNMPGMDGYTLAREIAANVIARGLVKLPVIGYSADGTSTAHRRCVESGMEGLLVKPVSLDALRAALLGTPIDASQPTGPEPSSGGNYLDNLASVFGTRDKVRQFVAMFLDLFDQDLADLEKTLSLHDEGKLQSWIHRAKGSTHAIQHPELIDCVASFSSATRTAGAGTVESIGAEFIAECRSIMATIKRQISSDEEALH